jgi:putative membrane protein
MNKNHLFLFFVWVLVLIWSAIHPKDYFTWFLEIIPALIGTAVLAFTYRNFKFTTFTYVLILIHCLILFVGGKYTYAENPLFETFKQLFNWERNNYDKLGHFAQGFIPALIAREILLRLKIVLNKKYIAFIVISIAMFISSTYELFEWAMSVLTGEAAEAFLGTQGYAWDTQSDMLFALIGSLTAIIFFSKLQDYYLKKII